MKKILLTLVLMPLMFSSNGFAAKVLGVDLEREFSSKSREYWLFIGNPGVGKSTFINSLMRDQVAPAGGSMGTGLTREHREYFDNTSEIEVVYVDTPGLNDISTREESAREIKKGLEKEGYYKIFYILTLESGRIRSDDLATLEIILESIDLPKVEYSIIINKIIPSDFNLTFESDFDIGVIMNYVNSGKFKTQNIRHQFISLPIIMRGIKMIDFTPQMINFLKHKTEKFYIPRDKVKEINAQSWQRMRADFETKYSELQEQLKNEKRRRELAEEGAQYKKELAAESNSWCFLF